MTTHDQHAEVANPSGEREALDYPPAETKHSAAEVDPTSAPREPATLETEATPRDPATLETEATPRDPATLETEATPRDAAALQTEPPPLETEPPAATGTPLETGAPSASRSAERTEARTNGDLFADDELAGLRARWDNVQAGFVDDPKECVHKADSLVSDVVEQLTAGFAQARSRLEDQWARGEEASTEDLRVALTQYREFFQRLLAV